MSGCIYCGISQTDWKNRGRIGCIHCVSVFEEEYTKFIPRPAPLDWEPVSGFPSIESWKKFRELPFEAGLKEIDSHRLPFTYRFRIARNPKNSIYPKQSGKKDRFIGWFLEKGENISSRPSSPAKKDKNQDFGERFPWHDGTLLAGDEDHIRWEYVTDSLFDLNSVLESNFLGKFWERERFDFIEGTGFITACPTNSGQGDKLSIAIPAKLADTGELVGFRLPTDWGFYREELKDRLVFFRKNFGRNRKNSFFNLVSYLALLVISGKEGIKASFPHNPF